MKIRAYLPTKTQAKGFTLIEMLVVLMIMALLFGIGANVMKNAASAQGTDTGIGMAESVFNEARGLAKTNGIGARVVIFNGGVSDPDSRVKHLRYLGVVRKDDNGTPNDISDDVWSDRLTSQGVLLPLSVYFNENLSDFSGTASVQIPGLTGAQDCFYYEFNGEGYLVNPNNTNTPNQPRGKFVVQSGRLFPTDDIPRVMEEGSQDVAGFAIWRRGNTSRYQTTDQISSGEDPTFQ